VRSIDGPDTILEVGKPIRVVQDLKRRSLGRQAHIIVQIQEVVERSIEVPSERQQLSASTSGMTFSGRLLLAYRFSAVLKALLCEPIRRGIPDDEQEDSYLLFNGNPSSLSEKAPLL
jgi:hypothetical protein